MPRLRLVVALLAVPLVAAPLRADERPLRAVIDAEVRAAWEREKIPAPALADDATFLRRIFLDLVGTVPTHDEVKSFLADSDTGKRGKLIDKLLDDPRFALHQADVWDQVLFGRNPPGYDATSNRDGFKAWLAGKFAKNEPYDRWARALLLAEEDNSTLFYVQYRDQAEETAVAVGRIFLGTQLQCARCHDHPYEPWTQRDFYGMAAFFARLVVVEAALAAGKRRFLIGEKSSGEVLFTGSAKEQKPGRKGEPIRPKFLLGAAPEEPALPKDFKEPKPEANKAPKPAFSRKEKLADWVVAPENPYFTRAAANRLWAQFLGRGLVHPVDDLSDKHPPSLPKLFDTLTVELKAHKFDVKWFIRELVSSTTYQASASGPVKEALPYWFERARVRPLSAEELLAAVRAATGFDATGDKVGGDTVAYVLRYFGEPSDGRGDFQGNLGEHLFLNNSEQLRRMIVPRKGNLADTLVKSKDSPEERVDHLFLSVLSRPPRPQERKRFVAHLATPGGRPEALVEEAIWALLNAAEFRFNH
ncbi:MAG TPA: DUF1549 and DUF1553 domain-containing protein [Gemmataceae bacterium]|nr:DUF1549 and DUF1553 domain-containing protein [Gemmataceae bacterium]